MRWIVRLTGALAVLAALAVAVVLLLPADRFARIVIDRLSATTGRAMTITGPVQVTLWPNPRIVAEGIEIANPDWAGTGPMISAREARLAVAWRGLFTGEPHVGDLVLTGAEITLLRAADGRLSWRGGADGPSRGAALDRVELVNGRLQIIDRQGDRRWTLRNLNAVIGLTEAGGAASLAGTARLHGTPLELSATVAGISGLITGETQPMRADLLWPGGTLRFDGHASQGGAVAGRISLDATDIDLLARSLGVAVPARPAGFGAERVALRGGVTLAQGGGLHLRDGVLRLDDTRLDLALDVLPGADRPMLRGTISGGAVALPAWAPQQALLGPEGWSDATMDVSGLFATDADLRIRAEELTIGQTDLHDLDLRATLTRGRLVFDIARLRVHGGQVAGQFVINGRGGLSVGGDLILANLDLAPTLAALAGLEDAAGRGSIGFEFLGVGDDLRTIIAGLEAEGDLNLGAGRLPLQALALLSGQESGFDFERITADFRVRDGVLQSDDMSVFAPWGIAAGSGELDLGNRTLDYRLAPEQDGVPILIRGPWDAPQTGPDPVVLAERAAEAAALIRDVRSRLSGDAATEDDPAAVGEDPVPDSGDE